MVDALDTAQSVCFPCPSMIRELKIENFRAFRELHLTGLGRVNLLVGANNSGKTSVLEAIALLTSGGDPMRIYSSLDRRGEQTLDEPAARAEQDYAVDVRHIFHGRRIGDDASLMIGMVDENGGAIEISLSTPRVSEADLPLWRDAVSPRRRPRGSRGEPRAIEVERSERTPRYLRIAASEEGTIANVALLPDGGLTWDNAKIGDLESESPVVLLTPSGLSDDVLAGFYEKIVMTSEEGSVIAALREVEGDIVRLATRQADSRGGRGFLVGLQGASEPVPLGSLGDGVHRMLAIALCLVMARGGCLLVDEIDLGLHHTVMRKMWHLVFQTAKRLNVDVFATAHSYDCVHALSAITTGDGRPADEVALIRLERGNPRGVHFSEEEIRNLAEWQVEAR